MGKVLVAYALADADVGTDIADALTAAGFDVSTAAGVPGSKADKDRFDAAQRVVLVWSRKTAGEAILRREAAIAATQGKLALVRVDGLPQPPRLRTPLNVTASRARIPAGAAQLARLLGRADAGAGPSLKSKAPPRKGPAMPSATHAPETGNEGNTWKGSLLLLLLLAGLAYGALFVVNGGEPSGAVAAFLAKLAG